MPGRKYHVWFDDLLEDEGVIAPGRNGDAVHSFLDRGAQKWGPRHRDLDPKHDAEKIRPWIMAQIKRLGNIKQDTATDYVRIAWGHIVLDEKVSETKDAIQDEMGMRIIASRSKDSMRISMSRPKDLELDWDLLLKRAWRSYRKCGFHKSYYKGSDRRLLEKAKDWLFGRGDRARL